MKKDKRIRQLEAELEAKNTVIESLKQELNYVREQLVLYKKTFYGIRRDCELNGTFLCKPHTCAKFWLDMK